MSGTWSKRGKSPFLALVEDPESDRKTREKHTFAGPPVATEVVQAYKLHIPRSLHRS